MARLRWRATRRAGPSNQNAISVSGYGASTQRACGRSDQNEWRRRAVISDTLGRTNVRPTRTSHSSAHSISQRGNPWSDSSGPAEPPYPWEDGPLYLAEGWLGSGESISSECTRVATCPGPADSGRRSTATRTSTQVSEARKRSSRLSLHAPAKRERA